MGLCLSISSTCIDGQVMRRLFGLMKQPDYLTPPLMTLCLVSFLTSIRVHVHRYGQTHARSQVDITYML